MKKLRPLLSSTAPHRSRAIYISIFFLGSLSGYSFFEVVLKENNEICDMKMVDFQMAMTGSAVFDLSLCFYTSVSGKEFNELDHYLRIYHKSLSESLKRYGCDAKKAYPYEILKSEWKKYCKFGFIMGIVLWTVKLEMSRDEVKVKEGSNEPILTIDEERFSEVINNLINHLGENDYL